MIMNKPGVDVIRFSGSDVVAASVTKSFQMLGASNSVANDITITLNDGSYTYTNNGNQSTNNLYNNLGYYFGASVNSKTELDRPNIGSASILSLIKSDQEGTSRNFDGTYTWNGSGFTRIS